VTRGRVATGLAAPALIGTLALVAFVVLGAVVAANPPSASDVGVRIWAMRAFAAGPLRPVIDALNIAGSLEAGAVATAMLAVLFAIRRRWVGAAAILSTWLVELVATAAKVILMRPRPPGAAVTSLLGETWSYPSGHVVRAVAVVAVLIWLTRRDAVPSAPRARTWPSGMRSDAWSRLPIAGIALIAGLLMGVARVAAGVHWPTDVLGGLLLSTAFVCLLFVIDDVAPENVIQPRSAGPPDPPIPERDPGGP
jgi:membrane-associated phospholipid phosphatase